jgi:predicted DNA-binding transcriptional regulator AlpA
MILKKRIILLFLLMMVPLFFYAGRMEKPEKDIGQRLSDSKNSSLKKEADRFRNALRKKLPGKWKIEVSLISKAPRGWKANVAKGFEIRVWNPDVSKTIEVKKKKSFYKFQRKGGTWPEAEKITVHPKLVRYFYSEIDAWYTEHFMRKRGDRDEVVALTRDYAIFKPKDPREMDFESEQVRKIFLRRIERERISIKEHSVFLSSTPEMGEIRQEYSGKNFLIINYLESRSVRGVRILSGNAFKK